MQTREFDQGVRNLGFEANTGALFTVKALHDQGLQVGHAVLVAPEFVEPSAMRGWRSAMIAISWSICVCNGRSCKGMGRVGKSSSSHCNEGKPVSVNLESCVAM